MRRIVAAVRESDVTELEIAHEGFSVQVRRRPGVARTIVAAPGDASDAVRDDAHLHRVTAPLTGIFYRAASPTARPYVSEGDWVEADSVIGLVETMKIFNEVAADRAGRVVSFAVPAGQLVHAGDTLMLLEPGSRTSADPEPGLS